MTKLIILVGLPGSGKTTYIKKNILELKQPFICDDYHMSSKEFETSEFYEGFCKSLKQERDIIISDIVYCDKQELDKTLIKIKSLIKDFEVKTKIEVVYFENDPESCRKNILDRKREERIEKELDFVNKFSKIYKIPKRAKKVSIPRPDSSSQ